MDFHIRNSSVRIGRTLLAASGAPCLAGFARRGKYGQQTFNSIERRCGRATSHGEFHATEMLCKRGLTRTDCGRRQPIRCKRHPPRARITASYAAVFLLGAEAGLLTEGFARNFTSALLTSSA